MPISPTCSRASPTIAASTCTGVVLKGKLTYTHDGGDERRFELPNAHAHALLDDDSEACTKPCAAVVPWVAKAIEVMVEEFRHGTGASFG
jgi:hypothetical protein